MRVGGESSRGRKGLGIPGRVDVCEGSEVWTACEAPATCRFWGIGRPWANGKGEGSLGDVMLV